MGKLLYCSPLVMSTDYELSYTADWSVQEMAKFRAEQEEGCGHPEENSVLDKLLLATLHNDFMEVIQISR